MQHEPLRVLKCYAGGQPYCIDVEHVLAIERSGRFTANPEPTGPAGWIVRRDKRVPVYELTERLGASPRRETPGAILVLDGAEPWAVGVDRVARFKSAPGKPQAVPPSMTDANVACYRGVIIDEGSVVLYLAPDRLHPSAARFAHATPAIAPPAAPAVQKSFPRRPGRILVFYPWNVSRVVGMGRTKFGLSYTQILEIVAGAEATPAPAAAHHVLGLIPWRGRAVPVIDIGALLGFEPIGHLGTGRLVILHSPRWQAPVAVPLGSGVHTHALPLVHRPCRKPLPLNPRYSRGAFELASGEILVLPDIDAAASPPALNAFAD